jgi:low affinity Fe/Cu permease
MTAPGPSVRSAFARLASRTAHFAGRPAAFCIAVVVVLVWAITGPLFGFSDSWQLVINTGTTIVTFLMVFLIQSTQNRDTAALQLKLDELIRAMRGARNTLIDLEELDDEAIERVRAHYAALAARARAGSGADGALAPPEPELAPPPRHRRGRRGRRR